MKVSIVIRNVVCEVVSCYCPQAGRSVNTKKKQLYEPMDKVVASEKMLVGGDFNDYVGGDMGMILFDWAVGEGLCLKNTCFQKRKVDLQHLDR